MNVSSLCLISIHLLLSFTSLLSARYTDNLFVQTCRLAAAELNETNCWVCAHMPSHQGASFPLQAVPANTSDLFLQYPGRSSEDTMNSVLDVSHEATFPVCFQWPARPGATDLGTTSRCQTTISRSPGKGLTVSGLLPSDLSSSENNFTVSSSPSPSLYHLLTAACSVWKDPFAACSPIEPWGAMEDYFWICGHKAYKQLPNVWSGCCALGRVVPAIRVSRERPAGRIRNVRSMQQSKDIVNTYRPLTDWDLYLSSWLPVLGTVRVGWAVYRLQAIIELLTNNTAETLDLIASEQRELRNLALQNRMALDMILASHGGVCALVGSECCVFVPDYSQEVFDHSKLLISLGEMDKDASHEWIMDLKEWLGSWWGKIIGYLICVVIFIIVIIICFKLIYCLICRMCLKSGQVLNVLVNQQLHTYEDTVDMEVDELVRLYTINIG